MEFEFEQVAAVTFQQIDVQAGAISDNEAIQCLKPLKTYPMFQIKFFLWIRINSTACALLGLCAAIPAPAATDDNQQLRGLTFFT